ncbi:AAA domain-containing protein [Sneathiella chungangensis]|uniref:AAA domain-containing protein n=1 Tax=Sneathiella chungangensis TaxID=1418234 RepID=A0A845MJJ4_9PROT|nr:MoxR family ATPase [Sneathiella chungangensis]MZR23124.1 AAA domain-containing protein [Sneathiella chungangensis]
MDKTGNTERQILEKVDSLSGKLSDLKTGIGEFIFGQDQVVELTLITLLAKGHALLIGVPGLAKTRLVETLGGVLGLDDKRVQFTPDLMPADILGSEILETAEDGSRHFKFLKGPIFGQILMADEINRASPRTQSALLQAMQEEMVTVAGQTYPLPTPFHVLATQNPIEQEGTYPLPEAQLDRFLMQINVGYPDRETERRILLETTVNEEARPTQVLSPAELIEAQHLVREMPVSDAVIDAILKLVREGRPGDSGNDLVNKYVSWGPGPRASQALILAVRARALLEKRLSPSIDDVVYLAKPVLRHRMALSYAARAENITMEDIIDSLTVPLE